MKTKILSVNPHFPQAEHISKCAKVIRKGGLVVFPTETVYGIAADYYNKKALKRLRRVKKRAEDKPFSVLISRKDAVEQLAGELNHSIYKLIDDFWPGPLTIVMPSVEENKTVGVRLPNHVIALKLIEQSQRPLAAPSANTEGHKPPRNCEEALKDTKDLVEIALEGGPVAIGEASTVVDMTGADPKILRRGPIPESEINRVVHMKDILFVCTGNSCRSVMAEYLMKKMLGDRKDVRVTSSGTSVYVSLGASRDTIEVLKKERIDVSMHRSRPLTGTLLKKSDLILVMTQTHRRQIVDMCPQVKSRVYLLREFAQLSKGAALDYDVPDPMGKPREVYEECIWMIKEAIEEIVKLI